MTILCYHSVDDDWDSRLSVSTDEFRHQARWLAENRLVLPLSVMASRLDDRQRPPVGQAAITFDDGWVGVYERAWPILRKFGLPFTVFVVTDTLSDDELRVTWVDDPGNGSLATMTRDQILEMAADGVEFASHSRRHHDLTTLDFDTCVADLRDSREYLSDLLGTEVLSVAYPRGRHDASVRAAARKAGYRYGFDLPESRSAPDPMAIPRVGVYPGNTIRTLRIKTMPSYLDVRLSTPYTRVVAKARSVRRSVGTGASR